MINSRTRSRLVESIKYDARAWKFPLTLLGLIAAAVQALRGRSANAFDLLSRTFGTGWAGSDTLTRVIVRHLYSGRTSAARAFTRAVHRSVIDATLPEPRTARFFDDPFDLFPGILIILRPWTPVQKGVVLIHYSSYFALFAKLFDLKAIATRYIIVLEPSWAGLCDKDAFLYTELETPVLITSAEERDRHFLNAIKTNLEPVEIGNNWWVDDRLFCEPPEGAERDIDIIMVAAWDPYKRHYEFLKAIATLRARNHIYKVTLVGYSGCMDAIQDHARELGVIDQITFYHCIEPSEVSLLYARAKVNVLWSRFEGNNKALVEGMLCGTPGILRHGHNFGQDYLHINEQTGVYATETSLPDALIQIIENPERFSPRQFILEHQSCAAATRKLEEAVNRIDPVNDSDVPMEPLSPKVNLRDGMEYYYREDVQRFDADHAWLRGCVRTLKA